MESLRRKALLDKPAVAQASFCKFLALYTLVLTALYSGISYKTPWCMLSFLLGMILLAGLGAAAIIRSLPHVALKGLVCLLLVVGLSHLGWQAYRASFDKRYYADWRNPYAYAHTSTNMCNFAARMERLARVHPAGHGMLIKVIAAITGRRCGICAASSRWVIGMNRRRMPMRRW